MTTKLINFKTFLSKAPYQPKGLKPCPPGEHRHWGRMDCHEIPQKHKKYLKQGIDLHHGMDIGTGQIPEGTIPPNAHDFYDDGHHMATAHGEHTGSKGGMCKPGEYPKGSGKLAPYHRHPGADYCHPVQQKHGGSSQSKQIAQQWHNTHAADIQASWYEFNEQHGLPQEETVPDPVSDPVDPYEGDNKDNVPTPTDNVDVVSSTEEDQPAIDSIDSPGSVSNPFNAQVNDIITLTEDYVVDHPSKTYKITDISENAYGEEFAQLEHTETGKKSGIWLSEDNIESIEKWQPEGEAVNSLNPHEFTIGSKFISSAGKTYEITGLDATANKIYYNVTDENGEDPATMEFKLDKFNNWVTEELGDSEDSWGTQNASIEHPQPPKGFTPINIGDTLTEDNISSLKIGDSWHGTTTHADGTTNITIQGTLKEIDKSSGGIPVFSVTWQEIFQHDDGDLEKTGESWDGMITGSNLIENDYVLAEDVSHATVTTPTPSEEQVKNAPPAGTILTSYDELKNIPVGAVLISPGNSELTILGNTEEAGTYHGGVIEFSWAGSDKVQSLTWEAMLQEGYDGDQYAVGTLPDGISTLKNFGYELGGKVTSGNFKDLPEGLSFLDATGSTVTVTGKKDTAEGSGIYVDIHKPSGAVYGAQFVSELTELSTDDNIMEDGFKIVGLPDGTTLQEASEPKQPVKINKHGLDKGTTVTVKNMAGDVSSAKIVKTHKTKAGQNYTLEYTDGPNAGQTTKISSGQVKDDLEGYQGYGGVAVDVPIYKPGQEPEETVELTLPPLGSEPGNWDDVLEKTSGKLGYNEGGIFKHKQTGQQYYIKFSSSGNDQQVNSEALANKLYELCGIGTLGADVISFQGKTALKSAWNPDLEQVNINDMKNEPGIMNSFVIDAWLANWDVIGPNHDNTQKSGDKIIKVDSGGSLKFRGAGESKPFPSTVSELESLRDPAKAKVAYQVFQNISEENLKAGAQILKGVKDSHIEDIVGASSIPISQQQEMADTLKARRDDILSKIGQDADSMAHPGQHKHAGYSGWHSKTQEHGGHLVEANEAHKKLKEGPYTKGATSEPTKRIWSRIDSTRSPEVQQLAQKARNTNFLVGSQSANAAAVGKFLKENNIKDTFQSHFQGWQSGNHASMSNVRRITAIRAALHFLKGEGDSWEDTEKQFWQQMGAKPSDVSKGWTQGINNAMAILPYIALSQQYVKANITNKKTGKVNTVFRGLSDKSSYSGTSTNVATNVVTALKLAKSEGEVEDQVIRMPNDGISGYSTSEGTAKGFAGGGGKGVVFKKEGLDPEDVLIHFNAFSNSHTSEQELLVDSAAVKEFSVNEVYQSH
tara:strand:- start:38205 stop:42197 length:3993 start_codon:yes stop_codon:yes gene_type:complete